MPLQKTQIEIGADLGAAVAGLRGLQKELHTLNEVLFQRILCSPVDLWRLGWCARLPP
jgi:hypothetical protein